MPEARVKSREARLLSAAVVMCPIVGVANILSPYGLDIGLGILLCVAAWGLHRRRRWAGVLAAVAAALIVVGNWSGMVSSVVTVIKGDARAPVIITGVGSLLRLVGAAVILVALKESWSLLRKTDKPPKAPDSPLQPPPAPGE